MLGRPAGGGRPVRLHLLAREDATSRSSTTCSAPATATSTRCGSTSRRAGTTRTAAASDHGGTARPRTPRGLAVGWRAQGEGPRGATGLGLVLGAHSRPAARLPCSPLLSPGGRRAARTTSRKDPPCSAPTRPARCVPTTPARPSPSPAGWPGVATTAGWPSSTCVTPRASPRSSSGTRCWPQGGAHDLRNEFCVRVTGEVREPPGGQRQPRPAHRRDRGRRQRARGAQPARRRCRSRSTSGSPSARRPG